MRYVAKAIEFEKGKDAVVLADVRELAMVLPKLIAATEAGELHRHISAVTKAKQPTMMKHEVAPAIQPQRARDILRSCGNCRNFVGAHCVTPRLE